MDIEKIGYCGLYCGGCKHFQLTQNGTLELDEENQPMNCDGCNSSRLTVWCADCAIKRCCQERGYRYCIECEENPCELVLRFMNDPDYPYHQLVQKDMQRLKEIGEEKWVEEMEKRYHCAQCNHRVNWFETECPACGTSTGIISGKNL